MNKVRVALGIVDGFVAATSVGGGIALVTGLEAKRFPLAWLRGTPFTSYTVPGLILAGVVGGSAVVATAITWRSPRAGGLASLLAGTIMMGWIGCEILLLKQPWWTWTELLYFVLGLVMVVLGLVVWRAERRHAGRSKKAGQHRAHPAPNGP